MSRRRRPVVSIGSWEPITAEMLPHDHRHAGDLRARRSSHGAEHRRRTRRANRSSSRRPRWRRTTRASIWRSPRSTRSCRQPSPTRSPKPCDARWPRSTVRRSRRPASRPATSTSRPTSSPTPDVPDRQPRRAAKKSFSSCAALVARAHRRRPVADGSGARRRTPGTGSPPRPAFGSVAPYTTRPMRRSPARRRTSRTARASRTACSRADASAPPRAAASRSASTSACAVGSPVSSRSLCRAAMTTPSRTTTAPIGHVVVRRRGSAPRRARARIASSSVSGGVMAEGVGFEPTEGCPSHAFQACRFGRSRTPPGWRRQGSGKSRPNVARLRPAPAGCGDGRALCDGRPGIRSGPGGSSLQRCRSCAAGHLAVTTVSGCSRRSARACTRCHSRSARSARSGAPSRAATAANAGGRPMPLASRRPCRPARRARSWR